MEIPGPVHDPLHVELPEPPADHADLVSVALEASLDQDERCTLHDFLVPVDELARDHDVDESMLVLEKQEDRPVRRLRTLADSHQAANDDPTAAPVHRLQIPAVQRSPCAEPLADRLHRVTMNARADRGVVEEDELRGIESRRLVGSMVGRGEREGIADRSQRFPCCPATITLPTAEGARARERERIAASEPRPVNGVLDRLEWLDRANGPQRLDQRRPDAMDVPPPNAQRRSGGLR